MRFTSRTLPHDVVHLVGAGVIEVLSFEKQARSAKLIAEILEKRDWRRPAGIRLHDAHEFVPESGITARVSQGLDKFVQGGSENFWHKGASVSAVVPILLRV